MPTLKPCLYQVQRVGGQHGGQTRGGAGNRMSPVFVGGGGGALRHMAARCTQLREQGMGRRLERRQTGIHDYWDSAEMGKLCAVQPNQEVAPTF